MMLEDVRARLHNAPDEYARDPLSTARPAHVLNINCNTLVHTPVSLLPTFSTYLQLNISLIPKQCIDNLDLPILDNDMIRAL